MSRTTTTAAPVQDRATLLQETVDRAVAKVTSHIQDAAQQGAIPTGSNVVHSAVCFTSENNTEVFWVLDNGDVFMTRSSSRDFETPLAPAIPGPVKKLQKEIRPNDEIMGKARAAMRKLAVGAFAILESRLIRDDGASRTLPGVPGKTYASGQVGEFQKYADANEKIGLGR